MGTRKMMGNGYELPQALSTPPVGMAEEMGAKTLTHAAEYLDLHLDSARRLGLFDLWEELGIIWTIPGTTTRRVLMEALRAWMYRTQNEQRPGQLAELFTDPRNANIKPLQKRTR